MLNSILIGMAAGPVAFVVFGAYVIGLVVF